MTTQPAAPATQKKLQTIAVLGVSMNLHLPATHAPVPGIENSDLGTFLTRLLNCPVEINAIHSYALRKQTEGDDVLIPGYEDIVYDGIGNLAKSRKIEIAAVDQNGTTRHTLILIEDDVSKDVGHFDDIQIAASIGEAWIDRKINL